MLNIFKKNKGSKVFVLSIDGVPFSFMQENIEKGHFPNFKRFLNMGDFKRMNSVQPVISSVAWSSFMTGKNPAKHNIYGFVDQMPGSNNVYIPTSLNMTSKTIWDIMSEAGKKVFVMNVPVTYPPRAVNGIMIGCFLCTQIEKIASPPAISAELKNMGYKIDADAWIARENLDKFLEEVNTTLEKRTEAMFHFLAKEDWDYFHTHIMETDRINHFLWEHMELDEPKYAKAFFQFYKRLDDILGEVEQKIGEDAEFIVLSDHGFCTIKKEIYLNNYLEEAGILKFNNSQPESIADMHEDSTAYSLIPGRVFVNLNGREPNGSISPGNYEKTREKLTETLLNLKEKDTGEFIIKEVIRRENIYEGQNIGSAADLIAVPHDGYDLKGNVNKEVFGEKGALVGMHTFEDSLLFVRNKSLLKQNNQFWIGDLAPTILNMMNIPIPNDMDGVALV